MPAAAAQGPPSLREALKILGRNPYHMEECVRNDHFGLWLRAGRGDGAAPDAALRGYDATTDFPRDLRRRARAPAPGRQGRPVDAQRRRLGAVGPRDGWHPQFLEKHWLFRLLLGRRARDAGRMYRERFFGGAEPSRDDVDALKRVPSTQARVRRTVPADRLLVHRATDGWAPLCAFLGKPIPDAPYPRVNTPRRRHIHLVRVPGRVVRRARRCGWLCQAVVDIRRVFSNPHVISRDLNLLARKRQQNGVIGLPPSPPRARLAPLLPPLQNSLQKSDLFVPLAAVSLETVPPHSQSWV